MIYEMKTIPKISKKNSKKKRFLCELCSNSFLTRYNYERHYLLTHRQQQVLKRNGTVKVLSTFQCESCGAKFNRKDNFNRHLLKSKCSGNPPIDPEDYLECDTCESKFKHKSSVLKHFKNGGNCPNKGAVYHMKCVFCGKYYKQVTLMVAHYEESHNQIIERELLRFDSRKELDEWKRSLELSQNCRFIKKQNRKSSNHWLRVFKCNRSGNYKAATDHSIRRMKAQGSIKINALCPAEIKVKESNFDGSCDVEFVKTHLGHSLGLRIEAKHRTRRKQKEKIKIEPMDHMETIESIETIEPIETIETIETLEPIETLKTINDVPYEEILDKCTEVSIDDSEVDLINSVKIKRPCLETEECTFIFVNETEQEVSFPTVSSSQPDFESPLESYIISEDIPCTREIAFAQLNNILTPSCTTEEVDIVLKYLKKAEMEIIEIRCADQKPIEGFL